MKKTEEWWDRWGNFVTFNCEIDFSEAFKVFLVIWTYFVSRNLHNFGNFYPLHHFWPHPTTKCFCVLHHLPIFNLQIEFSSFPPVFPLKLYRTEKTERRKISFQTLAEAFIVNHLICLMYYCSMCARTNRESLFFSYVQFIGACIHPLI